MAANAQSADTGGIESLGGKLLDDLAPSNSQRDDKTRQLPRSRRASAMVPLARVRQGMQNAQAILAQPGAETHAGTIKLAGSVQQEVVSELDKLIAELSKQCQCQGGQCDKPPSPNPNGKPKPGNKPG